MKNIGTLPGERNEHGHVVIMFTGLDLMGAQDIEGLEVAGYRVGNYAKSCFTSTGDDSYDKNHRLVAGQQYKIALVPGKEIKKNSDRTTVSLRQLGTKYGYGKPLAGHIPRVRESVSDKQMEEMGVDYIASIHDLIEGSIGNPGVLAARRGGDGLWVRADWGRLGYWWHGRGAFAFPVI